MLESNGRISETDAVELVTRNLQRLLGIREMDDDFVVYEGGGMFDRASKAVGVISGERKHVELF
jgi:hypothetical protein